MREVFAVTGYVSTEIASRLKEQKSGAIEIAAERDERDVFTQVDASHIAEVRIGAETGGRILVQLVLRDNAPVHTVIRSAASEKGLQIFNDPVLGSGRIRPPVRMILI